MEENIYYTHAGFFHADEVTGYAILELANICTDFERLTDLNNIPTSGIVADIGREYDPTKNRFDHHQGFFTRENGYPLASAGMIWNEYGELCAKIQTGSADSEEIEWIANRIDERLIQGIDAHDADSNYSNTAGCSAGSVNVLTLSNIIAMMNTDTPDDHECQSIAFDKAAGIVREIIQQAVREAKVAYYTRKQFDKVATIQDDVIVLSESLPWKEIVCERYPGAKYVIAPSVHPGSPYCMVAVPIEPTEREVKKPIERPEWFKGFIHQGKWIAGGESVEELINLASCQ